MSIACGTTAFTTSVSSGIEANGPEAAAAPPKMWCMSSLVSTGGLLCWLTVEQFCRQGSAQLGTDPFRIGCPCALAHSSTSAGILAMDIQKEARVGDTATTSNNDTWSSPTFPSSQLVCCARPWRVTIIVIFSRLRPVTCRSRGLHRACRILF